MYKRKGREAQDGGVPFGGEGNIPGEEGFGEGWVSVVGGRGMRFCIGIWKVGRGGGVSHGCWGLYRGGDRVVALFVMRGRIYNGRLGWGVMFQQPRLYN